MCGGKFTLVGTQKAGGGWHMYLCKRAKRCFMHAW